MSTVDVPEADRPLDEPNGIEVELVEPADQPESSPLETDDEPAGLRGPRREMPMLSPRWSIADLAGLAVAIACALFVFVQMRPDLLFANTTPSGGDMGAHVWGPAFLRDHLLPSGRLSGWTPDWYAGFPAYQYYMVVPSLAIVAVNVGLSPLLSIPLGVVIVAAAVSLTKDSGHKNRYRLAAVIVALLLVSVPYGVAFKLVSVSGLVTFPLAAWAMGRLARAPAPIPAFLPIGALFFLFDTNFSIYGGNIASTLAGEFAFSISLSLTLLAIGLSFRGMDDGTWRVPSAIVIALVALTHLIPVFFCVAALVIVATLGKETPKMWPIAIGLAMALLPISVADGTSVSVTMLAIITFLIVFAAVTVAEREVRERSLWLLMTGPVAALLSSFWLLPFVLREPYFNDMGWERLDDVGAPLLTVPMKVALPVAVIGAVAALVTRERIGVLFAALALTFAAAVANLGEGPLWNARLLPFYYLSIYFLAVVGAGLIVRFLAMAVTEDFDRPDWRVVIGATGAGLLFGLVAVAMPLQVLPGGRVHDDGTYRFMALRSYARSFIPSWTAWNYSGYERKPSYREYHDVVQVMDGVGEINGCGRAMWEYSKELDRYGTPMALMLLPHWTGGCIGSMEGLYFESSATTPFHFLNQSTLSQAPSRAQRDLPYQAFDLSRGVDQLQLMGVRYYMAQTDASIAQARANPDLTEVAEAQPFVVFEVAESGLVQALAADPVVIIDRPEESYGEEATRFDIGWLGQAVTHYNNPGGFAALPAEDGPTEWSRVEALLPEDGDPVASPPTVSNVNVGTSEIRFSVDQVGEPVLVKTSFFPNWNVSGADGPWRAGPNLMVVVPTELDVELTYGRTGIDYLSFVVTAVGLAGLVGLAGIDRRRWFNSLISEVWGSESTGTEGDLMTDAGLSSAMTSPAEDRPTTEAEVAPDGREEIIDEGGVSIPIPPSALGAHLPAETQLSTELPTGPSTEPSNELPTKLSTEVNGGEEQA